MKNHNETNLFYQYKGKIKNNSNKIKNNNGNIEINQDLQNQLNQLNQINNKVINENQQLKMELENMKKKTSAKEEKNMEDEIIMEDASQLKAGNKISKNESENKKVKLIYIKLNRKK